MLLEGRNIQYDKGFYLQIHHLDSFFYFLFLVFAYFNFIHRLWRYHGRRRRRSVFAGENNSLNHIQKIHVNTIYMHMLTKKGSTRKCKYNQKCLLCSNWRRNIFHVFFFSVAVDAFVLFSFFISFAFPFFSIQLHHFLLWKFRLVGRCLRWTKSHGSVIEGELSS